MPKFTPAWRFLILSIQIILCAMPTGSMAGEIRDQPVRIDVGGIVLNSILLKPDKKVDLPPIVFVHGASASLYDPMLSFRSQLEGRAELLFVDRPGHGRSDIGGPQYILPDAQADAIARLMRIRGISKAIVVGHSFGGAIAAELAVRHPSMVSGLVFLSPAVYPWKGGVAWYYHAASDPNTGALFSTLIVPPIGLLAIDRATRGVFSPNQPPDGYIANTKALQALRPDVFRHNAQEVAALSQWAETASKLYHRIKAPTVIITGDTDAVVSPEVHSKHLARDIGRSKLIVVHNLGHKSDYIARDLAVAAIERVAGHDVELTSAKKSVERRIAADGKN